jgi:long-chain fatty acid transport protein
MRHRNAIRTAALSLSLVSLPAFATNGYFSDGFGNKSQGEGGVGIALPQDTFAAASNPAGTALVGNRLDVGLTWLLPQRGAQVAGNAFGADASYSGDGLQNFFIPEFGYTQRLSGELAAGVAVYGNGGLNTDYEANPYSRFGAVGSAGVNLEQLFITPSLAWAPARDQSLGIGLNIAYQRFSAHGIGFFGGFSASPGNVSDQGTDSSTGAGIRLGWIGKIAPGLSAGATWASKVHGDFSKYRGLFADGGNFDIPENYGIGLAYRWSPAWTVAADVQRIDYGKVAAVGDPIASLLQGVPLGASGGPGFGWGNITVFKLGANVQWDPATVLRAGYSHSGQPIPGNQTFFNVLAPGVVQDTFTLGVTRSFGTGELSGFFAYAPNKTVAGSGSIPPGFPPGGFGGGEANISLKESILGISYGWKL